MKTMYASKYAEHSGYPLKTIKDYCKEKILPNERIGRQYLINVELADEILKERMTMSVQENVVDIKTRQQSKGFNFRDEMRRLRRES